MISCHEIIAYLSRKRKENKCFSSHDVMSANKNFVWRNRRIIMNTYSYLVCIYVMLAVYSCYVLSTCYLIRVVRLQDLCSS